MNTPQENTTPGHEDLLTDYATGALPEGPSLIVATYAALDETAREKVEALEEVGGAMIDAIEPAPLSDGMLDRMMEDLEAESGAPLVATPSFNPETASIVPGPLRRYLPDNLEALHWSRHGKSVEQVELPMSASGRYKASLLRIKAGETIPRHTHKGTEYTLVLAGGFTDEDGHHGRGDLSVCDGSVEHSPVADVGEDCICLTVLDAPIKMTGLVGRFVNPFLRF